MCNKFVLKETNLEELFCTNVNNSVGKEKFFRQIKGGRVPETVVII